MGPFKVDTGIILKPTILTPEIYQPYFMDYNFRGYTFNAIDSLFLRLLSEEQCFFRTLALRHEIEPENYPPKITSILPAGKEDPLLLCLSPRKILWYFLQYPDKLAYNNFFILKTNDSDDLRIVNIEFLEKIDGTNKYFLYLYSYAHWSILGRNLKGKSTNLITAFFE